jgi:hypothetical protein
MAPVPPGIGVIHPATSATRSKSTSPTMPASVREIPTSSTAAPGFTWSTPINRPTPTAEMRMSASAHTAASSGVREWAMVTVASTPLAASSSAIDRPTSCERPTTTARRPDSGTS